MKKIINGRLYDTDTAKEVGYDNDNPTGNWSETLYKKRTGEFFISHWDAWNGDYIEPISYSEAKNWMEDHGSVDEYAALFGIPDEDAESNTLCIRISAAAAAKLRKDAAMDSTTISKFIENLILNS